MRTIYEDVDRLTVRHGYAFLAAAAVCPGRHVGRSGALAAVGALTWRNG